MCVFAFLCLKFTHKHNSITRSDFSKAILYIEATSQAVALQILGHNPQPSPTSSSSRHTYFTASHFGLYSLYIETDRMSHIERPERANRQGQRRKHHRWSGSDHFHNDTRWVRFERVRNVIKMLKKPNKTHYGCYWFIQHPCTSQFLICILLHTWCIFQRFWVSIWP